MVLRYKSIDSDQIKTSSARSRTWRLGTSHLATSPTNDQKSIDFFQALPKTGEAAKLLDAANLMRAALTQHKSIVWVVDSAFIELGVSPLLASMIQQGLVHALAINGSAAQSDFELAFLGVTREDKEAGLGDGKLGLSREVAEVMNDVIKEGVTRGFGLGECLSRGVLDRRPKNLSQSLLGMSATRTTTVCVHLNLGSDGFQRYPGADGAALGKGGLKDANILTHFISEQPRGMLIVSAHNDPALDQMLVQSLALAKNINGNTHKIDLMQLGPGRTALTHLPDFDNYAEVNAPLELVMPMFANALHCLLQ